MKRIVTTPILLAMLLGVAHHAVGATSFVRGDGKRLIDIVISICDSPEGDDDGDTQVAETPDGQPDDINLSRQDKIEKVIQYFADGVYESTEGMHLLRNVYIFKNKANWHNCDIRWNKKGKRLEVNTGIKSRLLPR